jgi:zinc transport system ATP-binding protein
VDAENQGSLAEAMARLAGSGITIVLVAHELGPAAPVITRVVALQAGQVAYDGPPTEGHHGHDHHHVSSTSTDPFGMGS